MVAAAHDGVSTPEVMAQMSARIPGAELLTVDDAWHMSVFTDPVLLSQLMTR